MRYLRRVLLLCWALSLLVACGASSTPGQVTSELQSLLHAGATVKSCPSHSAGCTPPASVVADLSASADGTRVAVQYVDGHIVVWDLSSNKQLLRVPRQQTSHMWLTGGGRVLVLDATNPSSTHDIVELWAVDHRGKENRPQNGFLLATDWVWMDGTLSHILIVPNFSETCPGFPSSPCRGVPNLILYNYKRHESVSTLAPSVPPITSPTGKSNPQPVNVAPADLEFNQATGTFVIASSAQSGFITWKPGTQPVATGAQCDQDGVLTSDGRLFACISGAADALSTWDVSQRRMLRQTLLPDFASNSQSTTIDSVVFADGGRLLAVAEGRKPPAPYIIRIYRVKDLRLIRTLTLKTSANQFYPVRLWAVGQSLVVMQEHFESKDQAHSSRTIFVFSLS
jgi:WD40 repeat protein